MYAWLTGYDTFGYVFFQCLVLTDDGRLALLTRAPDRLQAQFDPRLSRMSASGSTRPTPLRRWNCENCCRNSAVRGRGSGSSGKPTA